MNYLIIDDEPIAHRIIEGYCSELPHLKKIGNAYGAFDASEIIREQKVDLIFLDINMPKLTGFEWLKTLSQRPKIIVTTAHKEYALEGYELDIIDYLLKPFSLSRFLKAVNKLSETERQHSQESPSVNRVEQYHFFIKGDKKHHQIKPENILFVEAFGNYSKVYLTEEMILSHENISTLEVKLSKENFLRIHKSFLVATDKIKLIQGNLVYLKDHQVPIGQTYRSKIQHLLLGK